MNRHAGSSVSASGHSISTAVLLYIANGSFAVQVNPEQIAGARYQPAQMADVDSER